MNNYSNINKLLLGLDETLLSEIPSLQCLVHSQVVQPLLQLETDAASAGFIFKVASSHRSFHRQLLIWNNKAQGLKPVFDSSGKLLDISRLTDREKVFAILRWSALPGASRHHWGTDMDVYDASRIVPDYQLQLTVAETEIGGPFAEFHHWLKEKLANNNSYFYHPYAIDRGGIAPEPWHISYAPLAKKFAEVFSFDLLYQQLAATEFELKTTVLDNLEEIYDRFIQGSLNQ
jgi:LAS superfamily LD-carboxypeptidase LdcB